MSLVKLAVVTADPARKLPYRVFRAPKVIDVAAMKYTLSAVAPLARMIEASSGMVIALVNWKMYVPAPLRVRGPAVQVASVAAVTVL